MNSDYYIKNSKLTKHNLCVIGELADYTHERFNKINKKATDKLNRVENKKTMKTIVNNYYSDYNDEYYDDIVAILNKLKINYIKLYYFYIFIMELYEEWFNNKNYWFSKDFEIDKYLSNKYFTPINNIIFNINDSKRQLITKIILLDQIPRHYQRINPHSNINLFSYSKKATIISELILKKFNNFTVDQLCFIYLPYRHINHISKICSIINIFINMYNLSYGTDKITCKKYIYNTLLKIYKQNNIDSLKNYIIQKNGKILIKKVLDPNSIKVYNNISNDKVYNIIKQQFLKLNSDFKIVISLSGGVDSMVLLHVIYKLNYKNLIAVHINYNNHTQCNDELDFINYYCNKLNIKLIYRTIFEINRNQCHNNGLRDIYEDITKQIRFDMYNLVSDENTYVILGHNKDDCFENIITNINNKKNYDNLSGMNYLSYIENINIFRPMLDIPKSDIINYANNNNIPYLRDSTPKWSMRGKIRDNIRPEFSNSMINSFFDLKEHCSLNNEIINNIIINNLINKFNIYNYNDVLSLIYINIATLFFKN